ncbi:signal peptide peptidase SppA [Candidatus Sumerlaeota bacterium]|nr:signal peptide peptidase SppA [Candidatus Sumerlaeota bacterium]
MRCLPLNLLLALALTIGVGAGLPEIDTTDIEPEPTGAAQIQRWVTLTLDEPLPERRDPYNFFNPQSENFRDLLDWLDEARDDEQVRGLILQIDSPGLGLSRIQSLRRAIAEFRAEDKQVIALLTSETMGGYLLATACDEIVMAPEGALLITGLRLEGVFLRGLLDLLGIVPEIIQIGVYKGAGDMFTERAFTDAMREAHTALVDDLWDQIVDMIAEGRGLEREQVVALIDQGPFTAEAAVEAGLVDQLATPTELWADVEISVGDGFVLDEEYGEEEGGAEELNIFELISMFQGRVPEEPESDNPKIALIYATGPIIEGAADEGPFSDPNLITSGDFIDLLHECRDDETVRAVVIRIDSPGGSATASDIIWSELRALTRIKPVVISMGGVAASGGYYIAMGATEILAEPGTLTGSIGVLGGKFVLTGLLEGHLGITHDAISRGQNAGLFSVFTPFSDSERAAITALMEDIYDAFTAKAAESRGMTREELEAVAQGRIWTGRQAVENGLVDRLGGLDDALNRAQELAELEDWEIESLEIMELPPPENFMEWFARYMGGEAMTASPPWLSGLLGTDEMAMLQQIHLWQSILSEEPILTLMPVMLSVQ